MNKNKSKKESFLPPINYDQSWKWAFHRWLVKCIKYFLPIIAKNINFNEGYKFLEDELKNLNISKNPTRVDKLIELTLHNKQQIFLLLHIEIQAFEPQTIAKRMFEYGIKLMNLYPTHEFVSFILYIGNEKMTDINVYKPFRLTNNFLYRGEYFMLSEHSETKLKNSNSVIAYFLLLTKWINTNKKTGIKRLNTLKKFIDFLNEKNINKKEISDLINFGNYLVILPDEYKQEYQQYLINKNNFMASALITPALEARINQGYLLIINC